jgi:uncharacterized protein (DUF2236 family)
LSWEIGRETALFLGGGAAVLLQLAMPAVACAVFDHSATKHDVAARFQRTFANVTAMSFGSLDTAMSSARRVHRLHAGIVGTTRAASDHVPRRYAANDTASLYWVHATLVYGALQSFELVVRRLSSRERDQYLIESHAFAQLFGIPSRLMHRCYASFMMYFETTVERELSVGAEARDMASFLLSRTPASPVDAHFVRLAAAAMVPPRVRQAYGMTFTSAQRLEWRAFRHALAAAYRWVPARHRYLWAYHAAMARLRGEAYDPTPQEQAWARFAGRATAARA